MNFTLVSRYGYQALYNNILPRHYHSGVLLLTLLFFLPGCATFESALQNSVKNQIAQEVSNGKTLLVFQFKEKELKEDPDSRHGDPEFMHQPLWGLTNVETGEIFPGKFLFLGYSPPTPDLGYVVVPAGKYFLKLAQPSKYGLTWSWDSNRYLVDIPDDVQSLYGGVFRVTCSHKKVLFVRELDECDETVRFEPHEKLREQFIRDWSADFGELHRITPKPLRSPPSAETLKALRSANAEFLVPQAPVFKLAWSVFDNNSTPDYGSYIPGPFRLPEPSYWHSGGGYGDLAIALVAVVAWSTWWVSREVEADIEESQWASCFNNIVESFKAEQLKEHAFHQWTQFRKGNAVAGTPPPELDTSHKFTLDFYRIGFRKCREKESLCLDMALRVAIEAGQDTPPFERFYVLSAKEFNASQNKKANKIPAHLWWETQIDQYPATRHISEYCQDKSLVQTDIKRGIEALLQYMRTDLLEEEADKTNN